MKISFFVPGIPAPGGSKRFVGFGKKTGRAILIDDAGQRNKDWRSIVGLCGSAEMREKAIASFTGPLRVKFDFVMPRRKGDFDSKGGVKASSIAAKIMSTVQVIDLGRMAGRVWSMRRSHYFKSRSNP